MTPQEINIEEKETIYDVKYTYHSDMMCQNYDAQISAAEEPGGRISLYPVYEKSDNKYPFLEFPKDPEAFTFLHSDPDRVIALAQMMIGFAQTIKNKYKKGIDTDANA